MTLRNLKQPQKNKTTIFIGLILMFPITITQSLLCGYFLRMIPLGDGTAVDTFLYGFWATTLFSIIHIPLNFFAEKLLEILVKLF